MKLHKFTMGLLLLLMASWGLAQAVNLTGTWKAKTISPRGTAEQTITFKQTGDRFTGEMLTSQGAKEAIQDGVVQGDEIAFAVERKQPSGETSRVPYKGKVKGDEITGTFTGASGNDVQWTAAREKPASP